MRFLGVCLTLATVVFIAAAIGRQENPSDSRHGELRQIGGQTSVVIPQSAAEIAQTRRRNAVYEMQIEKFSWRKGGFDTVMIATFTIRNENAFAVKDIEVRCDHSANSGTEIDSNTRTIYERIPAKGRKTIKDFNMGVIHSQATRSGCRVVSVVPEG